MKLKVIGTYVRNNVVLYEAKVLDGLLLAFYTYTDEQLLKIINQLRNKYPGILIYLDNGAFPLFQVSKMSYSRSQRYKNFNIVDHVERYEYLVKLIKPHWAPIPLDFIMLDRFHYTSEEIETNYKYTMKMNKMYSQKDMVPVAQVSSKVPIERYISDFKECKMDRLCIGGVATSGVAKNTLGKFVRCIKNVFPKCKIHVFGRPSYWFHFLEFLGIYSVDTNNLALWTWIKRALEEKYHKKFDKSLYTMPVEVVRQLIVKPIVDKLRWLKNAEGIDYTTTSISLR